jgi:predicted aspartyl protease
MNKPVFIAMSMLALLGHASQVATQDILESANRLFKEGKFAEAQPLYSKVQAQDKNNATATQRLGTIALFENKLNDAEKWLTQAGLLEPENKEVMQSLAQVHYRRDEFEKAARMYRAAGLEPRAKMLESFRGQVAYQLAGNTDVTSVAFVHTDPLPLIEVTVNGTEKVNFLIDTGAAEVYIDPELARKVKAAEFGATIGIFAGGSQAQTMHGRIDSLELGDFVVRNVPVLILNTRSFSAVAHGKQVDGIIGTLMLARFLATLDYPAGKLILRRTTNVHLEKLEKQAREDGSTVIPFWRADDHFLVAWGQVNKSKPMLFFVDTGLAGAAFTCPESTLKEAGIAVPDVKGLGIGGGGAVKLAPFVIEELSLGTVTKNQVRAFYGPFPDSLENNLGFRIGGLISHDFFKSHALTFDFTGMRLFLTK